MSGEKLGLHTRNGHAAFRVGKEAVVGRAGSGISAGNAAGSHRCNTTISGAGMKELATSRLGWALHPLLTHKRVRIPTVLAIALIPELARGRGIGAGQDSSIQVLLWVVKGQAIRSGKHTAVGHPHSRSLVTLDLNKRALTVLR